MKHYFDSVVAVPPPFGISSNYISELAKEVQNEIAFRYPSNNRSTSIRLDSMSDQLRTKLTLLLSTYFPTHSPTTARVVAFNDMSLHRYTALAGILTFNVILNAGQHPESLMTLNKRRDENESMDDAQEHRLYTGSSFIMEADCWQSCHSLALALARSSTPRITPLPTMLLQVDYVLGEHEQKHHVVHRTLETAKEQKMTDATARLIRGRAISPHNTGDPIY